MDLVRMVFTPISQHASLIPRLGKIGEGLYGLNTHDNEIDPIKPDYGKWARHIELTSSCPSSYVEQH